MAPNFLFAEQVRSIVRSGKREIELAILAELKTALERAKLGISISSIETAIVEPPRTVP